MDLKSRLRKAAGLFVEMPPDEGDASSSASGTTNSDNLWEELEREARKPKTVEQIVREAPGPNLDQIQVTANAPLPDGTLDFGAIYAQAGLPTASFTAEQTLEMIAGLPAQLPLEVKRQTLRVTFGSLGKTIGATPESVLADASRKLAALAAYSESMSKQTEESVRSNEAEMATLLAKVEELRLANIETQKRQARAAQMCVAESERLDDLLEFFSLDISPSKYAESPIPNTYKKTQ
jgi:hypothetical protein